MILTLSCSSDLVEVPAFAVGVSGPAVLDETGLVADWELIGGLDEELPYQTGFYEGDFGVVPTTPESTELVIVWTAVPCQTRPVARVSLQNEGLHIDVTPGPNPVEHCAAMAIGYGFRLILLHPVGDRSITARLIDQANQRLVEFP